MQLSKHAEQYAAELRLSVLGGFALQRTNGEAVQISNRKARALIAYLALIPNNTESRERLAGLLWSDRAEEQARGSLRQTLKQIRLLFADIGFEGFKSGRVDVSFDAQVCDVDLLDVAGSLEQRGVIADTLLSDAGRPERILYGLETLDQSFAAWLHVIRQNWHERLIAHLDAAVSSADVENAKRAAEAVVNLDPTHERAHRRLIRYHAEARNTPAALKQYKVLWDLLDEEYGIEPDEETQALVVQLKSGVRSPSEQNNEPQRPSLSSALAEGPRSQRVLKARLPVIEVAQFAIGGPWSDDIFIVEGFRRELIAAMARFREWIVVEGEMAEGHSNSGSTSDYKIKGVFLDVEQKVRLIFTLEDAVSRRIVWSETLSVGRIGWLGTQKDVVRRISLALDVYISAEKIAQLESGGGPSTDHYARWLSAHQRLQVWTPENQDVAFKEFEDIALDAPEFSRPYSSLATIYNTRHIRAPGHFHDESDATKALAFAKRAVELDPLDTRNQMTLAWSYIMSKLWDQAEIHLNLTTELNPNSPTTMVPTAHGLSYCGNYSDALRLAESAIAIHPTLPEFHWGFVCCIHFFNHNFDSAVQAADHVGSALDDILGWKAAALAHMGEFEHAKLAGRTFVQKIRRRWDGRSVPTDQEIVRWFMSAFPIREIEAYDMLREGLRRSGLPV